MSRALADAAGEIYGHVNGTDDGDGDDDHTTEYGTGTALVVLLLGVLMISLVLAMPWYLDDAYYMPLGRRKQQVVYVSTTQKATAKTATAVASPGGLVIEAIEVTAIAATRPDLSGLSCEKV